MNPICKSDINNPECQKWMNEVCTHCRDLFGREASDTWSAWWHDDTPAFYKDVPEMTVYDCKKLKHLLELEVAALHPTELITYASKSFNFELWQKILLIVVYIAIIVIIIAVCRFWKAGRVEQEPDVDEEKDENEARKSEQPASDDTTPEKKKKINVKIYMRDKFRPVFIHNEAALRQQQAKYKEKELLREEYTLHNVEKWTRAREKVEQKRREKKSIQLEKENDKLAEFERDSSD